MIVVAAKLMLLLNAEVIRLYLRCGGGSGIVLVTVFGRGQIDRDNVTAVGCSSYTVQPLTGAILRVCKDGVVG